MAIQTIFDTGSTYSIQSAYDGATYESAMHNDDCVCRGVGDEFTMDSNSTSLKVTFKAGSEAVIGGSFFKITADTTVTLKANSTIYLCATIDKTRTNGDRGYFEQRTSASIQKGSINGSDSVRDMLLYVITTNASGVTSVVDKRKRSTQFVYLTEAEYSALTTKDADTYYFVS